VAVSAELAEETGVAVLYIYLELVAPVPDSVGLTAKLSASAQEGRLLEVLGDVYSSVAHKDVFVDDCAQLRREAEDAWFR